MTAMDFLASLSSSQALKGPNLIQSKFRTTKKLAKKFMIFEMKKTSFLKSNLVIMSELRESFIKTPSPCFDRI